LPAFCSAKTHPEIVPVPPVTETPVPPGEEFRRNSVPVTETVAARSITSRPVADQSTGLSTNSQSSTITSKPFATSMPSKLREFRECFETRHRRKDGSVFPVEVLANALEFEGECFILAFVQDITRRRQVQEELRQRQNELAHVSRLSTMGEMASNMAHELNQPLSAIVNFAYVIEQTVQNDQPNLELLKDFAGKVAAQARRAGDIVGSTRSATKKK